jgi:hypothetical protein
VGEDRHPRRFQLSAPNPASLPNARQLLLKRVILHLNSSRTNSACGLARTLNPAAAEGVAVAAPSRAGSTVDRPDWSSAVRPHIKHIAAILAALAVGAAAQPRPDFSGRWTTDAPPATASQEGRGQRGAGPGRGDMGSGWGATITIAQDAGRLTVEYAFFGRGDMQPPLKFTYALDGSETRNTVRMGRGAEVQTSKTAWNGDALVITTRHAFTDPATGKETPVEVIQKLSLESPASLVVETTRAGVLGGPSSTTRTVYRRM